MILIGVDFRSDERICGGVTGSALGRTAGFAWGVVVGWVALLIGSELASWRFGPAMPRINDGDE